MQEQERDEILWRLDERTKRVDDHLDRLDRRVSVVESAVDDHEERIITNTDSIETVEKVGKGFGATVLALLSGIGAKLAGLLSI